MAIFFLLYAFERELYLTASRMVNLWCWSGGVVEWWSGGVVEWWSGGVVEWWKCSHPSLLDSMIPRARKHKTWWCKF